jgi:hypothetical protein
MIGRREFITLLDAAAAWLRLCACQCRPRYPVAASLPRPRLSAGSPTTRVEPSRSPSATRNALFRLFGLLVVISREA